MKSIYLKFDRLLSNCALQLNRRRRWYDKYMCDLDFSKEDILPTRESIFKDNEIFSEVSKRLSNGDRVSKCNMDTFFKLSCQYYNQRVHPKEINGLQKHGRIKELIQLLSEHDACRKF